MIDSHHCKCSFVSSIITTNCRHRYFSKSAAPLYTKERIISNKNLFWWSIYGPTTLSITTFSIMTFSIKTLIMTTFSITTLSITSWHSAKRHSVYAWCHLCQVSLMMSVTNEPIRLSVVMLSVFMLNVVALNLHFRCKQFDAISNLNFDAALQNTE